MIVVLAELLKNLGKDFEPMLAMFNPTQQKLIEIYSQKSDSDEEQ